MLPFDTWLLSCLTHTESCLLCHATAFVYNLSITAVQASSMQMLDVFSDRNISVYSKQNLFIVISNKKTNNRKNPALQSIQNILLVILLLPSLLVVRLLITCVARLMMPVLSITAALVDSHSIACPKQLRRRNNHGAKLIVQKLLKN